MFFRKLIIIGILCVLSSICNAEGILEKVIQGKKEKQKNAVIEILKNHQKYKGEIVKYLTKKRNWENEAEWPSENVLYLVGVIRDKNYFPILLSYLDHGKYCNAPIPEYTSGLEVALTLLADTTTIKWVEEKPNSIIKESIIADSKNFYMAHPKTLEERKKTLEDFKYAQENDRKIFERIRKMNLEGLSTILYNESLDYNEKDMAINCFRFLVDDKRYIPDLLYFLFNGPKDGAYEYEWACVSGIYNIFIQNGENK